MKKWLKYIWAVVVIAVYEAGHLSARHARQLFEEEARDEHGLVCVDVGT